MRAWLVGDGGDDQLDIRLDIRLDVGLNVGLDVGLMRDGTQIPHRDLIDNMTRGGGQRRSRVARVLPDRPTDPWLQRWPRAAPIRILGAMRISPGPVAGLVIVALLAGCAGADPACA
jgi:hypothetical protein